MKRISDAINEKSSVYGTLLLTQHCLGCLMCKMKEWRRDDEGMNKCPYPNFSYFHRHQHHAPGLQLWVGTTQALGNTKLEGTFINRNRQTGSHLLPRKHFSSSSILKRGLSGVTLIFTGSIGAPPITDERLLTFDNWVMVGLPSSRSRSITVLAGNIQRIVSSRRLAKSLIWTLLGTLYINPPDPC